MITIEAEGYVPIHGQADPETKPEQAVGLRKAADAAQIQVTSIFQMKAPAEPVASNVMKHGHARVTSEAAQVHLSRRDSVSGVVTDAAR